jgi:hypothetical protein
MKARALCIRKILRALVPIGAPVDEAADEPEQGDSADHDERDDCNE